MNTPDLLGELCARGVRLKIGGGSIRLRAQEGELTDSLRLCVRQHKRPIIGLLGDGDSPDEALPDFIRVPAGVPNTVERSASV